MKISLIGEYYSSNLGDPIITDCVKYMINELNSEIEVDVLDLSRRIERKINTDSSHSKKINIMKKISKISLLMNIRSIVNFMKWVFVERKYYHEYLKKNLSNSNAIIFSGGQLIMNNNLMFPLRIYSIVKYASKNQIPVYFNACGVQRYNKISFGTILLKKSLNKSIVKRITTRDDIKMLKRYVKDNTKVDKTVDSALVCADAYKLSKNRKSIKIGLGVISPDMYKRYYDRTKDSSYFITEEILINFWKEVISELENRKIEWEIFTNGDKIDHDFAIKLLSELNYGINNNSNKINKPPQESIELVSKISQYSLIISQRLHSHIIAFSLGMPSIGLIWDKKVYDFAREVNREEYFINVKKESVFKVIDLVENILNEKDDILNQSYKKEAFSSINFILESLRS